MFAADLSASSSERGISNVSLRNFSEKRAPVSVTVGLMSRLVQYRGETRERGEHSEEEREEDEAPVCRSSLERISREAKRRAVWNTTTSVVPGWFANALRNDAVYRELGPPREQ